MDKISNKIRSQVLIDALPYSKIQQQNSSCKVWWKCYDKR